MVYSKISLTFQNFWITPVKSGFNTVKLHWSKTGICSGFRATLGRMIFTNLIQKSEKQWKVRKIFLENLLKGSPSGNQSDYP